MPPSVAVNSFCRVVETTCIKLHIRWITRCICDPLRLRKGAKRTVLLIVRDCRTVSPFSPLIEVSTLSVNLLTVFDIRTARLVGQGECNRLDAQSLLC